MSIFSHAFSTLRLRRFAPVGQLALLTAIALGTFPQSAQAFRVFSGYDANPSAGTFLHATDRPNSNEAAETFALQLAAGSVSTEGFESFATTQAIHGLTTQISGIQTVLSYKDAGVPVPGGSSGSTANVQKATATGINAGMTQSGTFPTEGRQGISINSDNQFEILLGEAIAAFSFWGTDLGDNNNGLTLQLYNGSNLITTAPINYLGANSGDSSVFFFGGIADAPTEYFNRVVFQTSKTNDAIGLDQFTIAESSQVLNNGTPDPTIVPTPALLPGLLGLMMRLKLRRRATAAS
ncbi:MAG: PTPA-CTERM sorting domain-containing protein [Synechococcales cyanobacterium RU_4_20]|nr:PTPA-CTERM sorting domain-containing protein [Synechococcales cyanobacterium RU_4_20]NJR70204.1 PTPA-CTERM sorting domain-containing protein [Synechococcales cyanobacterium CRU_2_2]